MTQHRKPSTRHLRLLIPLFMLLFASLACDDYIPLPMVEAVMAGDQAGSAYARVNNVRDTTSNGSSMTSFVYHTQDYGKTWQRVEQEPPAFAGKIPRSMDLAMFSEKLTDRATNAVWWTFPRAGFRSFFHADTSSARFVLPYGSVSNSTADGILYIAMGTEGVVVAELDRATNTWHNWSLENTGIDAISPLKLTLTRWSDILLVVVLALLAPPLILIHQVVLKWVWSYVVREDGAATAARRTTLVITIFAIGAIVLWLTDARTDYYPVLAVMTGIVIACGIIVATILTRQIPLPVRLRVLIATGIVSLIIPAALAVGTGAAVTSWPVVIVLVWGFSTYRRIYRREYAPYINKADHPHPRWVVDRLALETVIIGSIIVALFLGMIAYGSTALYPLFGRITNIVLLGIGAFYAFFAIRALKWYIDGVALKLLDFNRQPDDPPLILKLLNWGDHVRMAAVWWLGALIFAGVTFMIQMVAYGWFQGIGAA